MRTIDKVQNILNYILVIAIMLLGFIFMCQEAPVIAVIWIGGFVIDLILNTIKYIYNKRAGSGSEAPQPQEEGNNNGD